MMIGAGVAAIPMAFALMPVHHTFLGAPFTLAEITEDVFITMPLSLVLCFLCWMAIDDQRQVAIDSESPSETEIRQPPEQTFRPALLDRLPVEKRGNIWRLESQDHYVLIVTSSGSELVLMRLADGIREVPETAGLQIHRSHWVAYEAMERLDREPGKNGRTVLLTMDGERLPISRPIIPRLRQRLAT